MQQRVGRRLDSRETCSCGRAAVHICRTVQQLPDLFALKSVQSPQGSQRHSPSACTWVTLQSRTTERGFHVFPACTTGHTQHGPGVGVWQVAAHQLQDCLDFAC